MVLTRYDLLAKPLVANCSPRYRAFDFGRAPLLNSTWNPRCGCALLDIGRIRQLLHLTGLTFGHNVIISQKVIQEMS
jgi:hypothetical protein